MIEIRPAIAGIVERRYPGSSIEKLAGDASTRVFYRVRPASGAPVVVVDCGEPFDGDPDYVRLSLSLIHI